MGAPFISDIGAYVASKEALPPKANGAGTRNGTGIDLSATRAGSAVLVAHVGAPTGAPSSFTYDLKLQHSNDNGVTDAWSDYAPPGGASGAIAQQSAAGLTELDVDLGGAKRYMRTVETIAITGGSSPTVPASAALILGGAHDLPV